MAEKRVSRSTENPNAAGGTALEQAIPRQKSKLPSLNEFLSLVPPSIIGVTGLLYLSGFIYRLVYLKTFGLHSEQFTLPIQDMIALGSIMTLGSVLAAASIYILLRSAIISAVNTIRGREYSPNHPFGAISRMDRRLSASLGAISILIVVAAGGGALHAVVDASVLRSDVDGDCSTKCSSYALPNRQVWGMIVAQTSDRTAIYTRNGVVIVATGEIAGVTSQPPSPSTQLPSASAPSGQLANTASPAPQPSPIPAQPSRPIVSR